MKLVLESTSCFKMCRPMLSDLQPATSVLQRVEHAAKNQRELGGIPQRDELVGQQLKAAYDMGSGIVASARVRRSDSSPRETCGWKLSRILLRSSLIVAAGSGPSHLALSPGASWSQRRFEKFK